MANHTLHLGRFQDVETLIPEVDCIITDPPFAKATHEGARSLGRADGEEKFIDFAHIEADELLECIGWMLRRARRWVVFTCDWRFISQIEAAFPTEFIRFGVWVKPNAAPQFTGDRPATGWEAVVIMHRKGKKRWNGGGHHAVWIHNIVSPGQNIHPTQKPEALMADFIRLFTDEGETILDPFMGSGSTGIAALKMGRKFIGCEVDAGFFAGAEQRFDEYMRQGSLAL